MYEASSVHLRTPAIPVSILYIIQKQNCPVILQTLVRAIKLITVYGTNKSVTGRFQRNSLQETMKHIPPSGKARESSTQKCRLVGDIISSSTKAIGSIVHWVFRCFQRLPMWPLITPGGPRGAFIKGSSSLSAMDLSCSNAGHEIKGGNLRCKHILPSVWKSITHRIHVSYIYHSLPTFGFILMAHVYKSMPYMDPMVHSDGIKYRENPVQITRTNNKPRKHWGSCHRNMSYTLED